MLARDRRDPRMACGCQQACRAPQQDWPSATTVLLRRRPVRLHRQIIDLGHECVVVAPSLIPMKAGDRIKTDRRDAVMLAKLHRAGELTAVWVPDAAHEAMRDLVRARATAVKVLGKARQHLQGFLLRHGRVYAGKKGWTLPYRRWLTTVRFDHLAQQVVLQDYIHSMHDAEERIARLTKQIEDLVPTRSMAPIVEAFQAMRGVAFVAAVTVVAEVGDFTRFDNPRQVMAYLGLTPFRAFERDRDTPRRHHQGRQPACTACLDRRGLDLSNAGPLVTLLSRAMQPGPLSIAYFRA
jgi:transposase